MSNTRIYVVTVNGDGERVRLVRASNKSQAIRHVADSTIDAKVAQQDDLVDLVRQNITIETAGEPKQ